MYNFIRFMNKNFDRTRQWMAGITCARKDKKHGIGAKLAQKRTQACFTIESVVLYDNLDHKSEIAITSFKHNIRIN